MKTYTITLFLTLFSLVSQAQEFELDSAFGDGGIVITKTDFNSSIYDVAQGPDGRIFASGYSFNSYNQLCAYHPDGRLDTTFGNNGFINSTLLDEESPLTMLVQPDGKIVVGGYHQINPEPPNEYHSYLIRYLPNGTLDSTFGESGIVRIQTESSNDGITSILLQADGKIVAGGYASPDFLLMRLTTNGDLDTSFGNNGIATTRLDSSAGISDIAIQNDGKIIAVGSTSIEFKSKFALARYTANGQPDKNFGTEGLVTTEFETNPFAEDIPKKVQLLTDGRILAVGYSRGLAMARYMPDGSMDTTFADKGRFTANNTIPAGLDVVLLNNNKIVVCGSADVMVFNKGYNLTMFHENGRLDSSFGNDGQLLLDIEGGNDQPRSMVLLSNNELVMAGSSKPERVSTTVPASFTLVKYVFDAVNSVTDQEPIEPWIIFPNPSSGYFSLVSKQSPYKATHIELLNSSGKVVLEQAIEGREMKIDIRQLPAGLYLYRIHSKQRMLQSGKMVKQ